MNLNFLKLCVLMAEIIVNYSLLNSEEEEGAIIISIHLMEILSNGKDSHFELIYL